MLKGILWDNDGVLVDTEGLYFRANREVLAQVEIELTKEMFRELFLKNSLGAWHLVAEKGYSEEEVAAYREQREVRYRELLQNEKLVIDGIEAVLQQLHDKFAMGIVTSCNRKNFDIIHQSSNLLQYFDFILAREDYQVSKPDPEPYLKGLERIGLSAEQCIVVEDSERGLIAATAAGLRCIVLQNELNAGADFSRAYCVVESVAELPEVFASLEK